VKHDPIFGLVYGQSGMGKTTDMLYSFPTALFIGPANGFLPAQTMCGYLPRSVNVSLISELTQVLTAAGQNSAAANQAAQTRTHLVVDDLSAISESTVRHWQKRGLSRYPLWGKVREEFIDFALAARRYRVDVYLNAWEDEPKTDSENQKYTRGGPRLHGSISDTLPYLCDFVYRTVRQPAQKPWPGTYVSATLRDFPMKDRFNVVTKLGSTPMNLAEILRARGVHVPRHPALPWQEGIVDALAAQMDQQAPSNLYAFTNQCYATLRERFGPEAARWTVRDAFDRSRLRTGLREADEVFVR
jgi:hypothetical protein